MKVPNDEAAREAGRQFYMNAPADIMLVSVFREANRRYEMKKEHVIPFVEGFVRSRQIREDYLAAKVGES